MNNFTALQANYRPPCHTEGGLLVKHPDYPASPYTCTICNAHYLLNVQGEPVALRVALPPTGGTP